MTIWIKCTEKQFEKLMSIPDKGVVSTITVQVERKIYNFIEDAWRKPHEISNREKIGIIVNNTNGAIRKKMIPEHAELQCESEYSSKKIKFIRTLTKEEISKREIEKRKKMSNG